MSGLPPYERNIGMVFQNYALWPHMTVAGNVSYGLRLRRLPAAEIAARMDEGLRKVNLGGFEGRYPGQLSGGQQQRVALARALVLNPDILLLDEPLSNLDAKIRVQVRAEIRKLQRELGITTVYVTHDQEEALSLSDRVAVMRDGKVLQIGVPRELYERPRTRFVADFVGTNNLLPGRVAERRNGALTVDTELGRLEAIAGGDTASGRCVLAIRPENVRIAPDGGAARRRQPRRRTRGSRLVPRQHAPVRRGDRSRTGDQGGHPGPVAPRPAPAGPSGEVSFPPPSPSPSPTTEAPMLPEPLSQGAGGRSPGARTSNQGGRSPGARSRNRPGARAWYPRVGFWIGVAAIWAFLLLFLVYPLCRIFYDAVTDGAGRFTLANFHDFFTDAFYLRSLWNSLVLGVATVVTSSILGIAVAFLLVRFDFRGRALFSYLTIIPIISPPLVGVLGFTFILGRAGTVNVLLWTGWTC